MILQTAGSNFPGMCLKLKLGTIGVGYQNKILCLGRLPSFCNWTVS